MKFKTIFILFHIIILGSLFLVFALPLIMGGNDLSRGVLQSGWPILLVMFLALAGFDAFYAANYRLFPLLEREDWPALVQYLERKVIRQGHYSSRLVRLLANTYLALSDSAAVMSLENKVALTKPILLDANALVFGVARILGKDIPGAVNFFGQRAASGQAAFTPWVRWYYGFALLMDRQFDEASVQFLDLVRVSPDGVLTGLSAYFLATTLSAAMPDRRADFVAAALDGRNRVLRAIPKIEGWKGEIGKMQTEVHIAILSKYIDGAGQWLYTPSSKFG